MAFLRSTIGHDGDADVRGRGVLAAHAADGRLRGLGRAAGAEPRAPDRRGSRMWARDELTRSAFRRRLRHYQREAARGSGLRLPHLPRRRRSTLLGGLTLSQRPARRHAVGVARLLDRPAVRRPRLHDARRCRRPCRFAFDTLRLHRLEAACLPHNAASIARARDARLPARGPGAPLSEDQRRLAGPRPVRAAARRARVR